MVKRVTAILMILCLILSVGAASYADTQYTVNIYSGDPATGTFSGLQKSDLSGTYSYGATISFQNSSVTVNDSTKYYVKGLREAGKDNSTYEADKVITVTKDEDYVVAYGVVGAQIPYTIYYRLKGTTTDLAASETYYGNPGDKPVASYKYIEGYTPVYKQITQTLEAGKSYSWVFEYVASPVTTVTVYQASTGGAVSAGTTATNSNASTTAAASAANAANAASAASAAGTTSTTGSTSTTGTTGTTSTTGSTSTTGTTGTTSTTGSTTTTGTTGTTSTSSSTTTTGTTGTTSTTGSATATGTAGTNAANSSAGSNRANGSASAAGTEPQEILDLD